MPAQERIQSMDALRGLCVLLMIAYHFGYDLVLVGILPRWVLFNPLLNALEPFFAGIFILLCGVSCRFSHSNLRRGALLSGVALLLTAVTWCLEHLLRMGSVTVWFGILHFLGIAILFY